MLLLAGQHPLPTRFIQADPAAKTETLRLSTWPNIGMLTSTSAVLHRVRRRMPAPSAPRTEGGGTAEVGILRCGGARLASCGADDEDAALLQSRSVRCRW